ncbi:TetR family transcriptional regulator [Actinoplanes sp. SE50]|uniref:TetR/AcrR family transcriptional regulator n=1 Tax=unclassified Actinoplanes TaxID=2626549 RepID=UPI00023EC8FC|nr:MULTISPECIES: TetR/AcrR family transcriptional regulator [unclassified Actinoplanes]AEV82581.1 HTH-type transcriptional regulator uidR [Actinoplanes sp. SE50/110]ATO80977.1 TetR family transcriptional regulator [Actinoplanes sp. SE50]SLL98384.1 putative TetR-family transcriptional regulator [Actinoplanes sp. SE50/110]
MTETTRPLRRDAQRNRERILHAAHDVFAARGFAATLDDVAHHAGVGVGTVYRRFPTKEALIEAIFAERLEDLVSLAEDALALPAGWDGLTMMLRRSIEMHAVDRGLRDAALCVGVGKQHFAEVADHLVPLVQELIDRAHAEGSLRPDVGLHDLPVIMATVTELAQHSSAGRPAVYRRFLELIIDGLRARPDNGDLGPAMTQADVEAVVDDCVPSIKRT